MLFSSPIFLFLFLPAVLLIYFLTPKRFKNYTLLVFSLFFYTWGEKELVVLIFLSTLFDYPSGLLISYGKRRLGLYFSIGFNVSILLYSKYANVISGNLIGALEFLSMSSENALQVSNIALPLGISFYTFPTMSYTIDVYRGQVKASKNFIDFATYVTLFPQLIAGPIVRYAVIEKELKNRTVTTSLFYEGVERFIIGLSKKMIIANNCALLADGVFILTVSESFAIIAWLGIIAYSFQIYFDFSGYSDMAIGLGKMFGFNFPENFNYPYTSKSIREFWNRWHITLSSWFKDYLYIPLGGNRHGELRTYFNLFFVFFITGLWHGASWTFVIWGILHGVFIIIERLGFSRVLNKFPSFVSHFYLLFAVNVLWPFFRCDSISEALGYLQSMFSFNTATNVDFLSFYLSKEIILMMVLATIFSMPVYHKLNSILTAPSLSTSNYKLLSFVKTGVLILLFVFCLFYVATDSYNPFIYF